MKRYTWRMVDTHYFLLHIWGDVGPEVLGPYRTAAERDGKARDLRQDDPEGRHGILMLDISARGVPSARAYQAAFLRKRDH